MGKRIIPQRRGKGGSHYRSPSHQHRGGVHHPTNDKAIGTVVDIVHDPARVAPVIKVRIPDQKTFTMLAPEGISIGAEIPIGVPAKIERGSLMKLGYIPDGTFIYNVELKPGDGGKIIRTAGTHGVVTSKGKSVMVQLPSGQFKAFNPHCRAIVGEVAGGGAPEKPFAKAGKKFHHCKSKARAYFKVSGVAMNPVDHPHGGGGHKHVGGPSTINRNAPPGRKVGRFSPKKRDKKTRR